MKKRRERKQQQHWTESYLQLETSLSFQHFKHIVGNQFRKKEKNELETTRAKKSRVTRKKLNLVRKKNECVTLALGRGRDS